jgi:hypothetical protein
MALTPNQIIQDNCVKNCAEGLKDALWLIWRTLVAYGDDYGVKKLAAEFHPEGKSEFLDYLSFDDMNFNERHTIRIDLALGMRSEENAIQRQQIIQQTQTQLYTTVQAMAQQGTLTPGIFKKIRKPYSDTLYVLGVKDADAYLPTEEEVMQMIQQGQEAAKNKQPSPDDEKKTADADLSRARTKEILDGIDGNTASQQLEGYALIKEHKARAYGP